MEKTSKILGIGITDLPKQEILEYLFKNVERKEKKLFIATINSEILASSTRNFDYKNVLNTSDLALIDGFWTLKAGRFLGNRLKGRIAGVDLVECVCREASKRPITVGFLGGRQNVAEGAANCLRQKYPGLRIGFAIEEWPDSEAKSTPLKCDILFVAFGHPRQEFWIAENLPKINAWAAMGVGGAFDFLSGRVKRAPKVIQDLGFEWLFRLILQPWRVRRQINLIYFVILILKEKLRPSSGR